MTAPLIAAGVAAYLAVGVVGATWWARRESGKNWIIQPGTFELGLICLAWPLFIPGIGVHALGALARKLART